MKIVAERINNKRVFLSREQDMYSVPRTILPHGASFNGHPVTLHITYESTKDTFTLEVLRDCWNQICCY